MNGTTDPVAAVAQARGAVEELVDAACPADQAAQALDALVAAVRAEVWGRARSIVRDRTEDTVHAAVGNRLLELMTWIEEGS